MFLALVAALAAGPQAVGYETVFVRDLSRPAISGTAPGRLIQISVWYPAEIPKSGKALTVGDYVHLLGRYETEKRTEATDQLGRKRFIDSSLEVAQGEASVAANIDKIAALPTSAYANAKPLAGRHPMVVFSEYRAPARNSILAEHLASHGFVVLSVPMIGSFDLDFDTGITGLESHLADVRYAVDQIARKPFVDSTRMAQMGVGIAANVAVAYAVRNPGLDALVSLDGGIMSPFEVSLMRRMAFFDPAAVRAPMLIVEAPFEGMDRTLLTNYRYADKRFVRFPTMREFHFLNYGAFEAVSPGVLGQPPPRVGEGFEAAARQVRAFLSERLKGERIAMEQSPDGLFTTEVVEGLPAVPTQPELRRLILDQGVGAARSLYEAVKEKDPQPFAMETLINTASWFGWGKDEEWKIRRALFEIYVDSYPQSSRGHFALANSCLAQKDNPCAKTHYEETLQLLPADSDSSIDAAARQRMQTAARNRLAEISGQ